MTLTHTNTIEYVDQHGGGCWAHGDNECLCDVDPARFVVGDGPYDIPPDIIERFQESVGASQSGTDDWFWDSYEQMVSRTLIQELPPDFTAGDMLRLLARPDIIEAVDTAEARGESMLSIAARMGVRKDEVYSLGRVMGVKSDIRIASKAVRSWAVERIVGDGMSVPQVCRLLEDRGITVKRNTLHIWARRFGREQAA